MVTSTNHEWLIWSEEGNNKEYKSKCLTHSYVIEAFFIMIANFSLNAGERMEDEFWLFHLPYEKSPSSPDGIY